LWALFSLESEVTPKQEYERRRAEREQRQVESEKRYGRPSIEDAKDIFIEEAIDRFVTAVERIADALEKSK
jgi:hypothetical protein